MLYNTLDNSSDAVVAVKAGGVIVPSDKVNITYNIEDETVAQADGNTITALKAGETEFTATCTFNGVEYTLTSTLSTKGFQGGSDSQLATVDNMGFIRGLTDMVQRLA